jgi:prepilin-type N-terminal cleavage/methylation domain-containing protein/prepilin-type processing-associated H-X9-DG protein
MTHVRLSVFGDARSRARAAFTLVELLVVIAIIGVLVGLLLPAVQTAREAARRSSCVNSMKQVALATQNYQDAKKQLPAISGGSCCWPAANNQARRSAYVDLLPFMEESAMFESIQSGVGGRPLGGPAGYSAWSVWDQAPQTLRCPSDSAPMSGAMAPTFNTVICLGDATGRHRTGMSVTHTNKYQMARGLWAMATYSGSTPATGGVRYKDCTDGLSKTILLSERCRPRQDARQAGMTSDGSVSVKRGIARLDPNLCRTLGSENYPSGQEYKITSQFRWTDGAAENIGFTAHLPPNSASCSASSAGSTDPNNAEWLTLAATSEHQGGVNVAFGDGAVKFVVDYISVTTANSGAINQSGSPSTYSVWGSLGSKAGGETASVE